MEPRVETLQDTTESIRQKTGSKNIIFAPEFLRESKAHTPPHGGTTPTGR